MFYVYTLNYDSDFSPILFDGSGLNDATSIMQKWLSYREKPTEPLLLEIADAECNLPDTGGNTPYGFVFSDRAVTLFKETCPSSDNEYFDCLAVGEGQSAHYTLVYPLHEFDCLNESRSIFIAQESCREPGKWVYADVEKLVLHEEMLADVQHFRIKGLSQYHFVSEALAIRLKNELDSSIEIESISSFFQVNSLEYKKFLETGDAYFPRTTAQRMLFKDKETYLSYTKEYNVRRRNLNDT